MSRYDASTAILSSPLSVTTTPQRNIKRAKLADSNKPETISSRIEQKSYPTIEAVVEDVHTVIEQETSLSNGAGESGQPTDDLASKASNNLKYNALKKILERFSAEILLRGQKIKSEGDGTSDLGHIPDADSMQNRLVLTLFGNTDRGPRQLFSSLQLEAEPKPAQSKDKGQQYSSIDESYLPNGITATKMIPLNLQATVPEKRPATKFGQAFRPHPSVKPLEPPKPAKTATSRSALTWSQPNGNSEVAKAVPFEKGDYKFSPLPTGQWLQYSGPKTTTELIAFNEIYNRDKGTVFSDKSHTLQPTPEDVRAAKEKAMFQSAYSSFAPTYDNAEAIVTDKLKSQVWWKKSGSARFRSLLASADTDVDTPETFQTPEIGLDAVKEEDFAEAVAAFVPGTDGLEEAIKSESVDEEDMDELLEEVSENLNTLTSYQQIRQSSQASGRPANGDTASFANPSSAESQIYSMLKTQLSLIIAALPPYAVAKLDGEQLEALDVGTTLITRQDDYAGVMEVDEFTYARERATASASAAASRPAPATQPRPGSYNPASTPIPGYGQRGYPPNARPPTNPATPFNRPTYSGATPSQNYAAARPMPQTVPRYGAGQQPYANSPGGQQFQRPLPNGYGGSYSSHQQAQNAAAAYMQRPGQPGYPHRPQDVAGRSASPPKPMDMLSRPPYAGPMTPGQQPRYFQQQPGGPVQGSPNVAGVSPLPPSASPVPGRPPSQMYMPRPPSTTPQPPNGQFPDRNMMPGSGQPNGRLAHLNGEQ